MGYIFLSEEMCWGWFLLGETHLPFSLRILWGEHFATQRFVLGFNSFPAGQGKFRFDDVLLGDALLDDFLLHN
jgi:hypothetical protein